MTYREQKRDKTQSQKRQRHSQRKDKCAASQEIKRVRWSSHLNLNVNVLIVFIVCDALASLQEKTNSHCNVKIDTYSYNF